LIFEIGYGKGWVKDEMDGSLTMIDERDVDPI
jgi:hypothetical protein